MNVAGVDEPTVQQLEWAIDAVVNALGNTLEHPPHGDIRSKVDEPYTREEIERVLEPFKSTAFREAVHRRLFCPEFYADKRRRFWCRYRAVKQSEGVYCVQRRFLLLFWVTRRYSDSIFAVGSIADYLGYLFFYKPCEYTSEYEALKQIGWQRAEPRLRKEKLFLAPADAN